MTSEIQQQQQQQRNRTAMLKTEKIADYSNSSSQPIFHRLAMTKQISSSVDCDDYSLVDSSYNNNNQKQLEVLSNDNSRSPTPFGGSSADGADQSELFQDSIENNSSNNNNNNNNVDASKHNNVGGSVMGIFFKVWSLVKG